jgi:hypothetical protein
MAEFKTIDQAAFKTAGVRGRFAFSTPRAVSARYDRRSERVKVTLDNGIEFACPLLPATGRTRQQRWRWGRLRVLRRDLRLCQRSG